MKHDKKKIVVVLITIVIISVGLYCATKYGKYNTMEVVKTHGSIGNDNGNYAQYLDGVLKYSKDGVTMLTQEGKQIWNQSCQMAHPIMEMNEGIVAIADQRGTSIMVFEETGLKGEIRTTKPIEKITVSNQGIVAAILQDTQSPQVICYDAKGTVLVEHNASFESTGYPLDVAISEDGTTLLVTYLCTDGNKIVTKAVFYNFGKAGENKKDFQVAEKKYEDSIIPTVAFIDNNTSLLISDHAFIFYEGINSPKEKNVIELDTEIKSVAYNEKYIAFVLKSKTESGFELRLYRTNGKQVMSVSLENEYTNVKIEGNDIVLYTGNACAIYNEKGIRKFEGTVEGNIIEIFPIVGFQKYMMISTNGFEEVHLVK